MYCLSSLGLLLLQVAGNCSDVEPVTDIGEDDVLKVNITGLICNTAYEVEVLAVSPGGNGSHSKKMFDTDFIGEFFSNM